ncbi:hypothetical protein, partial [Nonomuraea jabiensis]|uniref:hypothetical protein n=1 Tax=Nonomuraea jabiensis TaxID=882448 RepID=UPI00367CE174
GLPDGHTRATCLDPVPAGGPAGGPCSRRPNINDSGNSGGNSGGNSAVAGEPNPLAALLAGNPAAATVVARRPLSDYDKAALWTVWDQETQQEARP